MKTLSIRVPYAAGMGLVGMDDAAGNAVWHVLVRVPPGADVEWFEDAADAAEGDLAEALMVQRLAEAGWRGAADRLERSRRGLRQGGRATSGKLRTRSGERLAQLDAVLAAIHRELIADGKRKRIGRKPLIYEFEKRVPADSPLRKLATKHYLDRWIKRQKTPEPLA